MMTPVETAIETTSLLLKELNISPKDWRKLLELPAEKLFDIQPQLMRAAAASAKNSSVRTRGISASGPGGFSPVVDGIVLPGHPFSPSAPAISINEPLIIGWNEDEYTFFATSSGDVSGCQLQNSGLKVPNTDFPMGTAHAMDIGFKFNNVRPEMSGQYLAGDKPERFKASLNFAGLWTSFARTGKPGIKDQPEWPAYDLVKRPTYRIDAECEVISDRNKSERELWASLGYLGSKE